MTIYLLTEVSSNVGFGHLTRCCAVYEALEARGEDPVLIINSENESVALINNKRHLFINWIDHPEIFLNQVTNPGCVIIDSYRPPLDVYNKIVQRSKMAVYFDDFNRINYPKGIILNGAIDAAKTYPIAQPHNQYLLGPSFIPIRKEFWNPLPKDIKETIDNILLSFGGEDEFNITPHLLSYLNSTYPDAIKTIIIGKGFKNISDIENISDKTSNLIYFPNALKIKEAMSNADIAIVGSGQTLYELASVGTPSIAVLIAENQLFNYNGFIQNGFAKGAGWWNDPDLQKNIHSHLLSLQNKSERHKISKIGSRLVDGKGALRIAQYIIDQIN